MKKFSALVAVTSIIIAIFLFFISLQQSKSGKLDGFASCLKDKGAVFYGAFWCSHCQSQKKLFGNSERFLPYVECSTADGKNQTQICKDNHVESYPTWKFANGASASGQLSLNQLSEKTGCQLPK